ncbi:MAG: O-antigen ligase family protein [gamma proteobacterium endosymbiont of Lamellibrachia anaximandri]|nr:O-antigen ligase family protein [gamma proteobacterium endosymbiont of Lamellibrachia anaximandri]MBL3617362.1 O-antigen ligase family protein [gamma proteobacterium endosymbiont of Lamellibrachia anaximandri]
MMTWRQWQQRFDLAARGMAVFAAFSVPMPTAWLTVAMGLLLIFWLLGGGYSNKWWRMRENPLTRWSLLLLLAFALGLLYSSAGMDEALDKSGKYLKLLYIPLLISLLDSRLWQARASNAFLLAMLLTLAASWGMYADLIPQATKLFPNTVFRGRIAQNFFMAFTAYLLFDRFIRDSGRWRWVWGLLLGLALINVLLLVGGRTGQLVLLVLILLAAVQYLNWRGLLAGGLVIVLISLLSYQFSENFSSRVDLTLQRLDAFSDNSRDRELVGNRLEMYGNSLELIGHHLLVGTGSGSFSVEYAELVRQKGLELLSDNPHNEYLNITVQLGLVGLLLFLLLLYNHWRHSAQVDPRFRGPSQALVVAMAVGCLFNSFLMDRGEGSFYVVLTAVYLAGLSQARLREREG